MPGGAILMVVAGLMSGLLGIGSGALKVMAMDYVMHLPLKVSSATSNFMIGVTAGAGALVFLARGDVATVIAAPVALGVTAGALAGGRLLPHVNVQSLRHHVRGDTAADCRRNGMARAERILDGRHNIADEERILRVWTPIILRTILLGAIALLLFGLLMHGLAKPQLLRRALS